MLKNKIALLLIASIIIGILAAGHAAYWNRYVLEKDFNQVELMMDYKDIRNISGQSGITELEALNNLKEQGLTTVLFKEPTVEDIGEYEEVTVLTGGQLSGMAALTGGATHWLEDIENIRPEYTYMLFRDPRAFERVAEQLSAKTKKLNTYEPVPGTYIIETPLALSNLCGIGLGFPERKLELVEQAGLFTMVQIRNWPSVTPEGLEIVFEPIKEIPNLSAVLFNDETVPGFPNLLGLTAQHIKDTPTGAVVIIEFFPQRGLNNLGLLLDKDVIRLHSIPPEEMGRYNPPRALERYTLAATERNHRVLLIRAFNTTEGQDPVAFYQGFLGKMSGELRADGLEIGKASQLPATPMPRALMFLIGLGVIGGGLMLLQRLGVNRGLVILGLAGVALWAALLMFNPVIARKLMALLAVIIFPTLAVLTFVKPEGVSLQRAVLRLAAMSGYSLIGALLMVGLLADIGFMLKLDQFAGVKLAHVIPLGIVGLYFVYHASKGENITHRVQDLWSKPITIGLAVVGGVLLLAIAYYVARTGNEATAVSQLELQFRSMMDTLLGVRPRTKEFLLGHPLMLALLYFGYRNHGFLPLLIIGTIGQISLVNTFAHIHTPLLISLTRTGHGIWLGIAIGILLILAYKLIEKNARRYLNG